MTFQDPKREQENLAANLRDRISITERPAEQIPAREAERVIKREHAEPSEQGRQPFEHEGPTVAPTTAHQPSPAQPVVEVKSEAVMEIERILSEGLDELYTEMPPSIQIVFRQKGEENAAKILVLLQQVKVQVGKVLELIKDWLKIIPGVNKFFLEQEAKIKTDRLLALLEKHK